MEELANRESIVQHFSVNYWVDSGTLCPLLSACGRVAVGAMRVGGWRKSSYSSAANSACTEVASLAAGFAVRDSKDPAGPVVFVEFAEWRRFVADIRTGRFVG
jgi:hypothetical protein